MGNLSSLLAFVNGLTFNPATKDKTIVAIIRKGEKVSVYGNYKTVVRGDWIILFE